MTKILEKISDYDPLKPFLVERVAGMKGVTKAYVYMVLRGERDNDDIFSCYMELQEGTEKLLEAVKTAVPL